MSLPQLLRFREMRCSVSVVDSDETNCLSLGASLSSMLPMPKEITSLSISADSKYVLINHAPDVSLQHSPPRRVN